jgi:exopolysaccharide biosynthesis WecB/TagA/CpsF family protein
MTDAIDADSLVFLTLPFHRGSLQDWIARIQTRAGRAPFGYLVTPNVDHMVNYLDRSFDVDAYEGAEARVNDSRLLTLLAKLAGKTLPAIPGSDLVASLLADPGTRALRIAAVGPDEEDFALLAARYPALSLVHVPSSPRLVRGDADWADLVARLKDCEFDLLLSCVSFPKQEYLVRDLQRAGRADGFAICAGASLDFLTGKQRRAPTALRRLSLEWAYRLLSDPGRMWRRYLVKGPRIFMHAARLELFRREAAPASAPAAAADAGRAAGQPKTRTTTSA